MRMEYDTCRSVSILLCAHLTLSSKSMWTTWKYIGVCYNAQFPFNKFFPIFLYFHRICKIEFHVIQPFIQVILDYNVFLAKWHHFTPMVFAIFSLGICNTHSHQSTITHLRWWKIAANQTSAKNCFHSFQCESMPIHSNEQ